MDLLDVLAKSGFADKEEDWKKDFYKELAETIGARNQKSQLTDLLQRASLATVTQLSGAQAALVKGISTGLQNAEGTDDGTKEKLKAIGIAADKDAAKALEDISTLYSGIAKIKPNERKRIFEKEIYESMHRPQRCAAEQFSC